MALILGTTPIFIGDRRDVVGLERLGRGFWVAAAVSFAGVAFVASGSGGVLGPTCSATRSRSRPPRRWAVYSVAIAPLMRRYSPFRISALVLALGWVPLAAAGVRQTTSQAFHFG